MSWQNIIDYSNTQLQNAKAALDQLKAAEAQGTNAMAQILEDAGRWPLDLEPIDTTSQNLVRAAGKTVDGSIQMGPKIASDTLRVVGETVQASVPEVEELAPVSPWRS